MNTPQCLKTSVLLFTLCALRVPAADNQVMTFGGTGSPYVTGQTFIGVNDPHISNVETWSNFYGAPNSMTISAGTGENGNGEAHTGLLGGRSARLTDTTVASGYGAQLSLAGTLNTASPFTVSVSMRATGANATNGSSQVQFHCGAGPETGSYWMAVVLNANTVRFLIRNSANALTYVELGNHNGAMVRVSAVIDPLTRRFKSVVCNGVDYTSRVLSSDGGGQIPCLSATNPATTWVTLVTGTDDIVTADFDNIRVTNAPERYAAATSEEWLSYLHPTTQVQIQAGSALDFSAVPALQNGTIASLGRIRVGPEGELVYANGATAMLFCAAEAMNDLPLSNITDGDAVNTDLDAYVAQLQRAGYNCYRPHFLDHFLMTGTTTDGVFDTTRYGIWQRLVKKLYDANIYLYLDASTSWCAYYAVGSPSSPEAKAIRLKSRMYWDPEIRQHWKEAVGKIFLQENTHFSGTYPAAVKQLATSPQVLAAGMRNEADLKFQLQNDAGLAQDADFLGCWRNWVEREYGTIEAYNTTWNPDQNSFGDVTLPPYSPSDRVPLLQRFIVDLEQETSLWLQSTLRDMGVQCLLFDYNAETIVASTVSRDVQDVVDMHAYHDHGETYTGQLYSRKQSGISSFENTVEFIRRLARCRIWGKPMTVTEWGHVYPNPWRHESGLTVPSYAALQGWSMIAQHAHPVALQAEKNSVFWIRTDPPSKASEAMSAFLFRRGDVSMSPHRLAVEATPEEAILTQWGLAWGYNATALLTRIGLTIRPPDLIRDEFDGTLNDTLEANQLFPDIENTNFWKIGNNSPGSTTVPSAGRLVFTTGASAYPSAIVRTILSSRFNFFENPMSFELKDLEFSTIGSVAPDKKRLRLVLSSQTGSPFAANDAVAVDIGADNSLKVAYKSNASNIHPTATNTVFSSTLRDYNDRLLPASSIKTLLFTPIAVPQGDITLAVADPVWEVLVRYTNTEGTPETRRFNGRWHAKAAYSSTSPLAPSAWGIGDTCLQIELQKSDGLTSTGSMSASIGSFRMLEQLNATAAPLSTFDRTYTYDDAARPNLGTVISDLKTHAPIVLPAMTGSNMSVASGTADTAGGVFQSDTQQILLTQSARSIKINTPMSEGLTLPYDRENTAAFATSGSTANLTVENLKAPYFQNSISVFATSLTTASLNTSNRLLLIISGDALNNRQYFLDYTRKDLSANFWLRDENGVTSGTSAVTGLGDLPVLIKRSDLKITFKNSNAATLRIFPLNPNGTRQNPSSPIASNPLTLTGSTAQFHIDTGFLPVTTEGVRRPAVYFEVTN